MNKNRPHEKRETNYKIIGLHHTTQLQRHATVATVILILLYILDQSISDHELVHSTQEKSFPHFFQV